MRHYEDSSDFDSDLEEAQWYTKYENPHHKAPAKTSKKETKKDAKKPAQKQTNDELDNKFHGY